MVIEVNNQIDIINNWLHSDQTVSICGQDLRPVSHSIFTDRPLCIIKGQGAVYFLEQIPHGNIWLLKMFSPGRRPTDEYLKAVSKYLPGAAEFFTCKQRRFLTKEHVNITKSGVNNTSLLSIIHGSILMPKVPGMSWCSIADNMREGKQELSTVQRLQMCISLAACILMLEAGQCSHRDISAMNIFFDENGCAYIIDWDCLYHPKLPYQSNTTIGTMGYIAPFLKATEGNIDGGLSWCLYADRFALGILIMEILLVSPAISYVHEDGSLFSQEQINIPRHEFVINQIDKLKYISKPLAVLAEQNFHSSNFAGCPSPDDWLSALKYTLNKQANNGIVIEKRNKDSRIKRTKCSKCGKSLRMSEEKVIILKSKNQSPLCPACLSLFLTDRSAAKAQQDIKIPKVFCEHCRKNFRIPQEKLDSLLEKGRPILCLGCLEEQVKKWNVENQNMYPHLICPECKCDFTMKKDKLDILKNKGKKVLCRDCLTEKMKPDNRSKTPVIKKQSGFASSLWEFFGRTTNDNYC
jgi:serine/threonine protein kinase